MADGNSTSGRPIDLDAMVGAFATEHTPKLVRADKKQLLNEDSWTSPESVPVEEIRSLLSEYSVLHDSEGFRLPLHEAGSAELTGEYLLFRSSTFGTTYVYYDTYRETKNRIYRDTAGDTPLGWRLRFWHPNYSPSTEPSFQVLDPEDERLLEKLPSSITPTTYSESDTERFYTHFTSFVSDQKNIERRTNLEEYGTVSQRQYCRKHGGVHELVPVTASTANDGTEKWYVQVPEEDTDTVSEGAFISVQTGLWAGNEVLIDTPPETQSPSEFPLTGQMVEANDRRLTFVLSGAEQTGIDHLRESYQASTQLRGVFSRDDSSISLYPLFNPVPFDRELEAIRKVRAGTRKREVITGNDPLGFSPDRALTGDFDTLNQSQVDAASLSIAADNVALIHGPPGTGKTRTLTELVKHFVNQGKSVLACAHSNQATDNLLVGGSDLDDPEDSSLHEVARDGGLRIARVGTGSTNPVVNRYYTDVSPKNAEVVGATMSAASEFSQNQFDVAVVDEASQATIPATLSPYLAAEKLVLAGDHKQLPPYGSQELQERDMEISLFEHLLNRYGDELAVTLTTQYRMHEKIAEFSSEAFYGGRVKTVYREDAYGLPDRPPMVAYQVDTPEQRVHGRSYANPREAEIVAARVESLRESGVPQTEIGVITGYTGQIPVIRNHLAELRVSTSNVVVDTVDSFQGGERAVVVLSFVRSNDSGRSGFLSLPDEGPRRLNVALTRAKFHLVLIGNWDTLCRDEPSGRECCSSLYRDLRSWLIENDYFEPLPSDPVEST